MSSLQYVNKTNFIDESKKQWDEIFFKEGDERTPENPETLKMHPVK